ncbi:hypothetical protein Patl1_14966 [Pistacia atlantica]|uniref:Uncharacterized protein n=1 Tax=Pistacia atlantica TaxID=434234 RepID=A0ACC1B8I4_9ROSI|nr:hypothetical protein Patl1_14966 [Pistacia atlantica]
MRKKSKRAVEKVEEEAKNGTVELAPMMADNWLACEEWPWLKGVVDEQMSWGYYCLPNWGVEFMAEAYNALFSDVVWDDDIWNLKSIKAIPNP